MRKMSWTRREKETAKVKEAKVKAACASCAESVRADVWQTKRLIALWQKPESILCTYMCTYIVYASSESRALFNATRSWIRHYYSFVLCHLCHEFVTAKWEDFHGFKLLSSIILDRIRVFFFSNLHDFRNRTRIKIRFLGISFNH